MSESFDTVVIGAGVAGLAAATRLAEGGARTLLLEASRTLGGRARSWTDPVTGDVVDNGQHLMMGCYRETLRFLDRIGSGGFIHFQDRLRVAFADAGGEGGAIDCPPLPGGLPFLAGIALYGKLSPRDRIGVLRVARDIALSGRSGAPLPLPPDRVPGGGDETVSAYLTRWNQSAAAKRDFWDPIALAMLNERPEVASALTLKRAIQVALLGGLEASRLGWATVGLSDLYGPPAEAYIARRRGQVRVSSPVAEIRHREGGIEVHMRAGERMEPGAVIAAVPPAALERLLPPALIDSWDLQGIRRLAPAPIVGVNLWFERPFLEEPFMGLLGTTMQWLFNKGEMLRAGERRPGCYLALVVSGARDLVDRPSEDLVRTALAEIRALFPGARRARLEHALVVKERQATISPAAGWESMRPRTPTAERRLFLAGDWTATGLPATIESAAASGHRAADAVLGLTGPRAGDE